MLVDRFDRVLSYLRISVTDRCNFRCVYCMPAEGIELAPREEILSFEEIARVARVGASLGLTKIRLTGGEPTVRRELPVLVAMLREIPEICEVALTTNAARLDELAAPLQKAGLNRLNISLDTLDRQKAALLARRDVLPQVLAGIEASKKAGLPFKINTVLMRGQNDDEMGDLVRFALQNGAQLRFIEYMPMGTARFDGRNQTVPEAEVRERLRPEFELICDPNGDPRDPARGFVCQKTGAKVGFISSLSDSFCASCSRMRLTSTGGLRPCLHQNAEVDLRSLLRGGANNEELHLAFREAANLKWAGHHMGAEIPLFSSKEMVSIGG